MPEPSGKCSSEEEESTLGLADSTVISVESYSKPSMITQCARASCEDLGQPTGPGSNRQLPRSQNRLGTWRPLTYVAHRLGKGGVVLQ